MGLLAQVAPSQRNYGARVREFSWLDTPALALENEKLRLGLWTGRGSEVFEFLYKPLDIDLIWIAATGFRDAATRNALSEASDSLSGFLNNYGGGWQEVLPNGGAPSTHAGASYALHGDIGQLPWTYELLEDKPGEVKVVLSVRSARAPLLVTKQVALASGSARVEFQERVTNESDVVVRFMWGHHLAYGFPFLAPGARIALPAETHGFRDPADLWPVRRIADGHFTWPEAASPDGEPVDLSVLPEIGAPCEMVYLTDFGGAAWYELSGDALKLRVEWDARVMPYLWFWQEFGATDGYPWYGRHWNVGLEPFSSFPGAGLETAVANGTALTLGPRASLEFWMTVEVAELESPMPR
jgi:hypothetical protein